MQEPHQETDRIPVQNTGLPRTGNYHGLRGARVLVADNDPFVSDLISRLVKQHLGAEVVVVDSGSRAIAEVLAGKYDIAIIDLVLPRTSGAEAIKAIKEMMPDFPIIALSSQAASAKKDALKARGVECLFSKPVRISMLLDEITNIVKTGRDKPVAE